MSDTSLVFNAVGRDRGVSAMLVRTANQVNAANSRSVAGTFALRGAWVAAGAAAMALAGSALRAAGAAAAIPAAMASAFAVVGAGRALTAGLGDAWRTTGQAAAGGGRSVQAAGQQVAAQQREIRQATLALKDAQEEAKRAQIDLTRARQDEAERLSDLSRNLAGARLDEQDAIAGVAKAEMELALARRTGNGEKIGDAERNLEQSKQTLDEVKDKVSDLSKEQAEGAKKGVEGSDAVQDALKNQEMAQRRVEEAAYQLAEAQKAVETASAGAAGGGIDPAAQALARLSPNGRAVILMLRSLAPAWRSAANAGQQAMFAGVAGDLKRLSSMYLPEVTRWLTRMGAAFNFVLRDVARWLASRQGMDTVKTVMQSSAMVAERLGRAVRPIINGIAQWVQIGSSFLPGFASDAAGLAETFERWSIHMRQSGKGAEWIRNGVTVLGQFWRISRDVAMSIIAIVRAGGGAGGTVVTLEKGAAAMRKFLESAKGQEQIKAVFDTIRNAIAALGPLFGVAAEHGDELGQSFGIMATGASAVADMLGPLLKYVPALAAAYLLLKHTGVTAMVGLGVKAWQIASQLALARAVRAHTMALRENTVASGMSAAAQAREAAATNAGMFARVRSIASLVAQKIALMASAVASGIAAAAGWVMAAAEWAVASPIALIIIGIALFAAGIYLLWTRCETFRKIVTAAFNNVWGAIKFVWEWVKSNWKNLLTILTGPIGLAVRLITTHWGTIKNGAASAVRWIVDKFDAMRTWFSRLPGRIGTALRSIAKFFIAPFRAAFNAVASLWNRSLANMRFTVPGWVPGIGGSSFALPSIPYLAKGGNVTAGGSVMVGEAGPEILTLPPGASVTPLDKAQNSGGQRCHHTFDVTGLDRHMKALIRELLRTGGLGEREFV